MALRLCSYRLGLALLLLARPGRAQSGSGGTRPFPFDSLRATVRKAGLPDTERVFKAMEAYQALIYARPDSAPPYVQEALSLARRIGFRRGEANAYGALAGLEYQAHRYARAQQYYQLMLGAAQKAHHTGLTGSAYAGMASMAVNTGNVADGLRYYGQARATFAKAHPRGYNNEVLTLYNLANYYLNHQQKAAAAPLLRQAVALLPHCTWPELPVAVTIGLGQIQQYQHQPDSAVASWQRAVRLGSAAHLDQLVAEAHGYLGARYLAQHRPALALAEAQMGVALARRSQSNEIEVENLDLLAEAMHALGQPAAYDTLRRLQALSDTVHAHENTAALTQAQARFNDVEQQAQIRSLQQDRRLAAQTQELTRLRYRQQVAGVSSLAGGLLLLAGWAFWQYRRRQALRQATYDTALRTRLAADLHDDVGALLTQISLQSDLLREAPAAPEATLARLERLSDTSRRAARQMADVVWGLHASSAELPEVVMHMREHAHEVLPPAGLAVDFAITAEAAARNPNVAVCQTLYLIYKEALHNAVKHARGASQVTIRLSLDAGQLCLSVRDNAPGPAPASRPGGHGLTNMRQRAEAVGGALHFVAEATGFGVVACLPG
ncbi:ATP-binding protein [Hymenobacter negativus]|uniref:histidine kinase n=1 Tax=Hymenobacter negativus TaxID=2795026 RepID=A0ABS3Q9V3_9BACT|nr:ATP-binding protein [Hymenobacter negativus]MBO2007763.1 ATP-binding protein [Hymenobacter negativus]